MPRTARLEEVSTTRGSGWIDSACDTGSDWLTHPLPRVVLTSSRSLIMVPVTAHTKDGALGGGQYHPR